MHSQGCILRRGGESWPNKTQVTPRRISLTRDERRRSQAPLVDQNSLRNADSPVPGVPPGPPGAEQGLQLPLPLPERFRRSDTSALPKWVGAMPLIVAAPKVGDVAEHGPPGQIARARSVRLELAGHVQIDLVLQDLLDRNRHVVPTAYVHKR